MFTLLGMLVRWIVGTAAKLLPESPLRDVVLGDGLGTGLGWLNWLVPMRAIVALVDVWLVAVLAWRLYKVVSRNGMRLFQMAGES